jgi:hypothetical protein
VDFIQLAGRTYVAEHIGVRPAQLSRMITHVRCSLIAEEDEHRGPPPVVNGTAAFLRAGAPVYEIRGYSPGCRLAAYLHGRLQAYLAQHTAHGSAQPVPCSLHPGPAKPARAGGG